MIIKCCSLDIQTFYNNTIYTYYQAAKFNSLHKPKINYSQIGHFVVASIPFIKVGPLQAHKQEECAVRGCHIYVIHEYYHDSSVCSNYVQ